MDLIKTKNHEELNQRETEQEKCEENQEPTTESVQKEKEETRQTLHTLYNINTELAIQNENKQLIFAKASQEVSSYALHSLKHEIEEELSQVKAHIESVQSENQELTILVEKDQIKLMQIQGLVRKTAEMANSLTERFGNSLSQYKKLNGLIDSSSMKVAQQVSSLETLKKALKRIAEEKKKSGKGSESEKMTRLKAEIRQRKEHLDGLKRRTEEVKKMSCSYEQAAVKYENKITAEQNRLDCMLKKKESLEDELKSKRQLVEERKKEDLNENLEEAEKRKDILETEKAKSEEDLDVLKNKVTCKKEQVLEKKEELEQLMKKHKSECDELKTLKEECDDLCEEEKKRNEEYAASTLTYTNLLNDVGKLKKEYFDKYDQKILQLNTKQEIDFQINKMQMEVLTMEKENEVENKKLKELQDQHTSAVTRLNSLQMEIDKEKEMSANKLEKAKAKIEETQKEISVYTSDLDKKKDYILKNASLLKEKNEKSQAEYSNLESALKNTLQQKMSLSSTLDQKKASLKKAEEELEKLKTFPRPILKPDARKQDKKKSAIEVKNDKQKVDEKKVQFNELISYKSASSNGDDDKQLLEASVNDWLGMLLEEEF